MAGSTARNVAGASHSGERRLEGGVAFGRRPNPSDPSSRLVQTIEAEVIPRLLLARRALRAPPQPPAEVAILRQHVAAMVDLSLGPDTGLAELYLDDLRNGGLAAETVCLDVLAPTACELGLLWDDDRCSFVQVTLGLARLHRLLRGVLPDFTAETDLAVVGHRILLAPAPGDQHTFGLSMVAGFFGRAGWDVTEGPLAPGEDVVGLVSRQSFAVVGLSLSSDVRMETAASVIRQIRRRSLNRTVGIMVGGPLLVGRPELATLLGADATAADGREAARRAHDLVTLLQA